MEGHDVAIDGHEGWWDDGIARRCVRCGCVRCGVVSGSGCRERGVGVMVFSTATVWLEDVGAGRMWGPAACVCEGLMRMM